MSLLLAGRRVPGSPSASWRVPRGGRFGRGVRGGCRVWSAAGPPPFFSPSPLLRLRAPASASAAAVGGPRAFCLFPDRLRDLVCTGGRYVISSRAVCRDALALLAAPAAPPRRGSPALTVPGRLRRVRGWWWCRCRGWARAPRPAFWASRVRPAPVRVPSSRVPARRFKDPGGVALPSPGSGGGGARRDVGRPREGFPVPPPSPRPALPQTQRSPLRPPALPEAAVGGACREPPLGARGVPGPGARLVPPFGGPTPGAGFAASRVPCVPPFRFRPCFFLLTCVSFRFSLAGLRRSPLAVGPLSSRAGGAGGGACCRRQHPCESAHTPDYRYDS